MQGEVEWEIEMKAILLAGGQGSRLRPLTLNTPKPIVPIFDRPFLRYQIELLRQAPEIDEIVLSLNYQPRRIEEVFGDGSDLGVQIRYVVEPQPLGTGGAIKFAAGPKPRGPVVVFNGDVLTSVDLPALLALHRERKARATIVLTPVDNPTAFGLVETDADGNVKAFREKPAADEITVDINTINAGIYVLEGETLDRIPADTPYSIERGYFPSLIEREETFVAHIYRGYWIDIGTREKNQQVHADIMTGRFTAPPFDQGAGTAIVSPEARVEAGATIEGPCFVDAGVVVKAGARIGPYSVIGAHSHIAEDAEIEGAILWPHTWVDRHARLGPLVAGRHCQFGRNVDVGGAALFGDNSVVTDFSRV
jgi:NDP-sugar pyrophosphorylase family protein